MKTEYEIRNEIDMHENRIENFEKEIDEKQSEILFLKREIGLLQWVLQTTPTPKPKKINLEDEEEEEEL